MSKHIDPSREQFGAFMKSAGEGPIWMLNLIRLRQKAKYERTKKSAKETSVSGADAYKAYARESEPFFKGVGGRIVWSGEPNCLLIGPEKEHWDLCFVAEYPSAQAFADMVKNPGYQATVRHRQAAAKDTRLLRLKPGMASAIFG
jgi:uncharacterized protein (DUF1330 family)